MLDGVNNQNKNKENIANDIAKIKRLIESKTSNLIVEGTYREIPKEEIYNFENFEPFLVNKTPFIIGNGHLVIYFYRKTK